uniref:DNA-directed RNA polymerase n=1 Tax=Acrobeloides nanus TaxID=290746 RepID=A0A914EMH2_9BILA
MSRIKISDGNSTLFVWTDRDNGLTLETLKSVFPDATNLINRAHEPERALMSITDGKISNPDGWDPNAVYLVHNGLRPTSPIPDVMAVSILKSQPLHFDRYKKFLFYAEIDDEDTLLFAPITIINETNAVGAYHVFEKFIPKEGEETKLLKIRSQFSDETFEIKADRYCDGTFCQVILFKAFKPNKFHVCSKDSLIFGPPMIGWPYFTVGYPGETFTEYDGNPINMSYLAGDISSVAQDSHFLGSSGSRPGFSGGPVFSEYAQQLVGFVVGGGPNAKTCGETIDKYEQARYLIASFALLSNPRNWAHGEGCFKASPDVSLGSDAGENLLYKPVTGEFTIKKFHYAEPAVCGMVRNLHECDKYGKVHALIQWRITRNPIIGDKFASRHGQKGINSFLWPAESLPFSESGMVPDIIFNPHGFPSRMTIGMMIESMAGKAAAMHCDVYDASPFVFNEKKTAIDHFGQLLTAAGYNYYGNEVMYSGVDGREMEVEIFFGVVYYQRLRHMVADKFQVRATGPVDPVTLQPVKGRKKGGGIRFGEMERDALIAHGSSFCLQDRLFNCSDRDSAYICRRCGSLLSATRLRPELIKMNEKRISIKSREVCLQCGESDEIFLVQVPRVFRYLAAELFAMSIKIKLSIEKPGDINRS